MARKLVKVHDENTNTDVEFEEEIIEAQGVELGAAGEEAEPNAVATTEAPGVEAAIASKAPVQLEMFPEEPPQPKLSAQTLAEMATGAETLKRYAR